MIMLKIQIVQKYKTTMKRKYPYFLRGQLPTLEAITFNS